VGVDVHPSRCGQKTVGGYFFSSPALDPTHFAHQAIIDRNVGSETVATAAVDHRGAPYDGVVH
jgi:hypothetical protein